MSRAVFLDRDGVLIEDVHLLTRADQIRILPTVPAALGILHRSGFRLVVVSNQTVVARGMIKEREVELIHDALNRQLTALGAPGIERFYFCPHHPAADLPAYRVDCECRKPRPGLILRAARELGLDPARSFLVGDRPSDILAGRRAGCRTIWVQTGRHKEPAIQSSHPAASPGEEVPDHTCGSLSEAAEWILTQPQA